MLGTTIFQLQIAMQFNWDFWAVVASAQLGNLAGMEINSGLNARKCTAREFSGSEVLKHIKPKLTYISVYSN